MATHPVQNVVAMGYYSGSIQRHGDDAPHTLHVCLDILDNGQCVPALRTTTALSGVVARSTLCVDNAIRLHGQICTPEQYIALWREVLAGPQLTLTAWLQGFEVRTTMDLPAHHARHEPWLTPLFKPARARLFGTGAGPCSTQIRTADDIRDAVVVIQGLAAFGMVRKTLTDTLSVSQLQRAQAAA